MAVEGQRIPDLEREQVGHAVGDSDLPGAHRIAASAQREQRAPEHAAGVLGANWTFSKLPGTTNVR